MRQTLSQASLSAGTVLAKRYRVEELIGSGGYASVYRATDMTFGYERAIKEVTDQDPGVRQQFQLESELLINTKHPNIPHGYHLIEDRGHMYLIMEYVLGKDVEELLNESLTQRGHALDEGQVLRWMLDVCGALIEMHTAPTPIIHRDIKPANIKITPDGRPVLIDFGLAKLHRVGRPTLTAAQGVSPGFAPPEQYMAKGRTDARTDIYAVGATLYACLTGKDAPEAPARLLAQTGASSHAGGNLVPPHRYNPRISEPTERLILKALELAPAQRQQSAEQLEREMSAALRALEAGGSAPGASAAGRRSAGPAPISDLSAKRAALTPGGAPRGTGYVPAAVPGRSAARQPVPAGESFTGKQPAVAARAGQAAALGEPVSAKQPAILRERLSAKQAIISPDRSSGKQPVPRRAAISPLASAEGTAAVAALPRSAPDVAPTAGRLPAAVAAKEREPQPPRESGAWVRFGTVPLSAFGKGMLAFSTVEALWGAVVLAVGILVLLDQGRPFPTTTFALGFGSAAVLLSVLGGQALTRPVYRRGTATPLRRGVQGTGLVLYTLAVHAVAVWGAMVFSAARANGVLAVAAFLLFGLNVLVVGMLSIANLLG